jgi:hypothetical protein
MSAKYLLANPTVKERRVLDTLLNIGLLLPKKIKRSGLCLRYYDPKSKLLITRRVLKTGDIQYEAETTDDPDSLDEKSKLLVALATKDRIITEHYISGNWEVRLAKLAEERRKYGDEIPKIQRPSKTIKPA